MNRAFVSTTLARLMTFGSVVLAVLVLVPVSAVGASAVDIIGTGAPAAAVGGTDGSDDDTTRPTINEFFPEERPLGDCLSSLPKPDCGSEARGGWAQTTVFLAIVAGLAFIAWRVVVGARRARRDASAGISSGTPDATTVPGGDGGGPTP